MTVVRDERGRVDVIKELQVAVCGTKENDNSEKRVLYHEDSGSLEIKTPAMPNIIKKKEAPLFSEEEMFAMVRENRRKR